MNKDLRVSQANEESDDYLIELMGLKKEFKNEALDAYGKIYSRYWPSLLMIAKKILKNEDEACDLVADTLNRIYERAASYKRGKVKTKENLRFVALSWMTQIMRGVFYDLYLEETAKIKDKTPFEESYIIENVKIVKHLDTLHDDLVDGLEKEEGNEVAEHFTEAPYDTNDNISQIENYLSKLPEREKDIIRTSYNMYVPGKNTPTEVLNYIENKWGTRRENIRKILEKFRKSIKKDLQVNLIIRK